MKSVLFLLFTLFAGVSAGWIHPDYKAFTMSNLSPRFDFVTECEYDHFWPVRISGFSSRTIVVELRPLDEGLEPERLEFLGQIEVGSGLEVPSHVTVNPKNDSEFRLEFAWRCGRHSTGVQFLIILAIVLASMVFLVICIVICSCGER